MNSLRNQLRERLLTYLPHAWQRRVVFVLTGFGAATFLADHEVGGVGMIVAALGVAAVTRTARDPVTLLSVMVVLLFVVSARYVVGPLGALGRPALILQLVAFGWWSLSKTVPHLYSDRGRQPVRIAAGFFAWALLASYPAGYLRPLQALEASSATRGVITVFALVGVTLLAADGIFSRERLDLLLRRLVVAAWFLAAIGLLQSFTGFDFAAYFDLPGLRLNQNLPGLGLRYVPRVTGTALHAIEFGVVLATLLPLAIHFAMFATDGWMRIRYWSGVALIAFAIPMSVSRSSVLALAVALGFMAAAWTWRQRLNALVIACFGLVLTRAAVPGLLGTIRSLFENVANDPSIEGRTSDYDVVAPLILERPLFGRGIGTFLPELYRLLDNQYLGTLVESGLVGLVALVTLLAVAISVARGARHRSDDPATRHLGQALAAALATSMVLFATFDALSFPMYAGTLFLLAGSAGALWRLEVHARSMKGTTPSTERLGHGATARLKPLDTIGQRSVHAGRRVYSGKARPRGE